MGISQKEWVELLKEEYFSDFIRSGGSAIRIVTIPESDSDSIIEAVDGAASEKQFLVARVNSADVRVDKIEMIFHEVAKQVELGARNVESTISELRKFAESLRGEAADQKEPA